MLCYSLGKAVLKQTLCCFFVLQPLIQLPALAQHLLMPQLYLCLHQHHYRRKHYCWLTVQCPLIRTPVYLSYHAISCAAAVRLVGHPPLQEQRLGQSQH